MLSWLGASLTITAFLQQEQEQEHSTNEPTCVALDGSRMLVGHGCVQRQTPRVSGGIQESFRTVKVHTAILFSVQTNPGCLDPANPSLRGARTGL